MLEQWAERFSLLMVPVTGCLLALIFRRDRRYFLFDHFVFAMHTLSFQGLLLMVFLLLPKRAPDILSLGLFAVAPVHLFVHLRSAYDVGAGRALWTLSLLLTGMMVGAALLLAGLLTVGLVSVGAEG